MDGVSLIKIHQVLTQGKGNLQFFEGMRDIPFEIKRIYYISNVKAGIWRGAHAHKTLKQLLFCPYGKIVVNLNNIAKEISITLDSPDKGILIEKPLWRDMFWKIDNSILCVAASDYYFVEDYIREYSIFKQYIEQLQSQ
ncbi:hypothetical protein BSR42_13665 [Megasphaera cerevisiae]|nr:hypothetical protein BSR42_13665 [Megasphaera cerevisiae]